MFNEKLSYWPFPAAQKMCAKCKVVTTFSSHLVFYVLFYERKDCPLEGDSEATINSLSSWKCLDTLKNRFVERSAQYTSFSSSKQPANTSSERKQFTSTSTDRIDACAYKMPSCFYWVGERTTKSFFFLFSKLRYGPFEFNPENFANIWQIKWKLIRSMKFETAANLLFKWIFGVFSSQNFLPWQRDLTTSPLYSVPMLGFLGDQSRFTSQYGITETWDCSASVTKTGLRCKRSTTKGNYSFRSTLLPKSEFKMTRIDLLRTRQSQLFMISILRPLRVPLNLIAKEL